MDRTGVVSAESDDLVKRIVDRVREVHAGQGPDVCAEAVGELLFDLANLARGLGIDAESALREANTRFETRFRAMERDEADRI